MKKLFLGLLLAVGFSMNAQVTFKPGLRGGLNLTSITQSRGDFKPTFYIGALGEIKLTKRYALQPEIIYSSQGSNNIEADYYDFNTNSEIKHKEDVELNYISLAGLNKFYIVDGFHALVGPTLDFLVSDNLVYHDTDIDLGITFGFGYTMPSGLTFEARFKKGIVDVLESEYYQGGSDFFFGDYNTNILFQFGVSYAFDFKKKQ